MRAETLRQLPHLKLIAVAATGYDVVDVGVLQGARHRRRQYPQLRDTHRAGTCLCADSGADGAICLPIGRMSRTVSGTSPSSSASSRTISAICTGLRLGIIGEGAIGQATAAIGRAFGMRVLFADHPPPKMEGVSFTPHDAGARRVGRDLAALSAAPATRNLIDLEPPFAR
jgi:glycerate dehydrogenase